MDNASGDIQDKGGHEDNMNDILELDDEELLEALRAVVLQVDDVPPEVVDAAKASFAWLTIDAELAELTFDSLIDVGQLALVRGGQAPRLLTFEAPDFTVEVEVETSATGRHRRLVGQVVPPQSAQLELHHLTGKLITQTDPLGRFAVAELVPGPVCFRCYVGQGPDAVVVETDWVTL